MIESTIPTAAISIGRQHGLELHRHAVAVANAAAPSAAVASTEPQ